MADVVQFISTVYDQFHWFIQLGYVIVISTILAMLLVNLWKVTFLKKFLTTASPTDKDKVLGSTGTVTSLVVYAIVYVVNEMVLQRTFLIVVDWHTAAVAIPSGAAIVWVAAKGLYTVLHKFIQRCKDGKLTKKEKDDTITEINEVEKAVKAEQANAPKTLNDSIGSTNHRRIL